MLSMNGIYACFGVQGNTDQNQHMNTYGLFYKESKHIQQSYAVFAHAWLGLGKLAYPQTCVLGFFYCLWF